MPTNFKAFDPEAAVKQLRMQQQARNQEKKRFMLIQEEHEVSSDESESIK